MKVSEWSYQNRFVRYVQDDEEGNVDVGREEIGRRERHQGGPSSKECNDGEPNHDSPCKVWLEGSAPRQD